MIRFSSTGRSGLPPRRPWRCSVGWLGRRACWSAVRPAPRSPGPSSSPGPSPGGSWSRYWPIGGTHDGGLLVIDGLGSRGDRGARPFNVSRGVLRLFGGAGHGGSRRSSTDRAGGRSGGPRGGDLPFSSRPSRGPVRVRPGAGLALVLLSGALGTACGGSNDRGLRMGPHDPSVSSPPPPDRRSRSFRSSGDPEGWNGETMSEIETVRVEIPTPLRGLVDGRPVVEARGTTVGAVLEDLAGRFPALRTHLFGPSGTVRGFVSIYLNQEDIRYREREATPVRTGDVISIVPAIAGGAADPAAVGLSPEEMLRYSRHLLLPEVGLRGQRKLKEARVLLVGAGGLGSPTATYLAAAGVGRIGLVEFDTVDLSNLQRQILYTTEDVGRPKLEAAAERLRALNPEITVVPHPGPLTSANALDLLKEYDVVVDGTDNFPTRYLVNDAAVLSGIPNVYGSIYRFEGQVTVFAARSGPCYRCLYPEPPPPNLVPSCAEAGVLGVLPGVVGVLQAIETLKLLLGTGEPLIGRLVLFDALALRFRELQVRPSPDCSLCGPKATQRGLIDYPDFCGVAAPGHSPASEAPTILPQELAERLHGRDPPLLLDVREPEEWAIARIEGARLLPLGELAHRVDELTGAREIIVYCKMGGRSAQAVARLTELGFRGVRHLDGGIDRWRRDIDPSMPRY